MLIILVNELRLGTDFRWCRAVSDAPAQLEIEPIIAEGDADDRDEVGDIAIVNGEMIDEIQQCGTQHESQQANEIEFQKSFKLLPLTNLGADQIGKCPAIVPEKIIDNC